MYRNLHARHGCWRIALICALVIVASEGAFAQGSPTGGQPAPTPVPTPQTKPSPTLESRFFKNILRDQRAIWTAPFNRSRANARWFAPLGISTAILFVTDRRTAGELTENGDDPSRLRISRDISRGGSFYTTSAVAGTFYLIGRAGKTRVRARRVSSALKRSLIAESSLRPLKPPRSARDLSLMMRAGSFTIKVIRSLQGTLPAHGRWRLSLPTNMESDARSCASRPTASPRSSAFRATRDKTIFSVMCSSAVP